MRTIPAVVIFMHIYIRKNVNVKRADQAKHLESVVDRASNRSYGSFEVVATL